MTINDYLQKHYETLQQKVKAVTKGHQNSDDLLNDCIIDLIGKGNDYIHQLLQDGKVQHYIVKMCYIQYNSSTSPFYTKYRKQKWQEIEEEKVDKEDTVEIHEDTERLGNEIKLYIGKLPFYQRELANKHFVEGQSQREMSKMYNINRIHISRDLNRIKKNLHLSFSRNDYKTK
jgi:RNA polymerase sigma factor (sigma-70 family)